MWKVFSQTAFSALIKFKQDTHLLWVVCPLHTCAFWSYKAFPTKQY